MAKTIKKQFKQKVIIEDRRKEKNPYFKYNVKILNSNNFGKTYFYTGNGKFTKTKKDALLYRKNILNKK